MSTFYEKYVALCAKKNKTPSGAAVDIGLSKGTANGWKTGRQPNDLTIAKIALYFGVPVSYFSEDNASSGGNNGKTAINGTFEMASAEEKMDMAARLISSLTEEQQAAFIQRIMFKKEKIHERR